MFGRLALLAIGGGIVFILGVLVAIGNVMNVTGVTPERIHLIVEAAAEKRILGDVVFALIPFTAIAMLNISRHLLMRGDQISSDYSFYGFVILPLMGFLLYFLIQSSTLWGEIAISAHSAHSPPIEAQRLRYVESALWWNIFLLFWYEVLIAIQEEWLVWRT